MAQGDVIRFILSLIIALGAIWASLSLKGNTGDMDKQVMDCYVDRECFAQNHRDSSEELLVNLTEEISCASESDSMWGYRFPNRHVDSLPLLLQEIILFLRPLNMRSNIEHTFIAEQEQMIVTLYKHTKNNAKSGVQFQFVKSNGRFDLKSVKGLCKLLTNLSLAKQQQNMTLQNLR